MIKLVGWVYRKPQVQNWFYADKIQAENLPNLENIRGNLVARVVKYLQREPC